MCLSIPVKVESVEGDYAVVSFGNNRYKASIQLLDNVSVGNYVLLHAGFAIQIVDTKEAEETLKLIDEMEDSSTYPNSDSDIFPDGD